VIFAPRRAVAVWGAGAATAALLAVASVATATDTGLGSGWYLLQLVQSRSVPASGALLIVLSMTCAGVLLVAVLGRIAYPSMPTIRHHWTRLVLGERPARSALASLRAAARGTRARRSTASRLAAPRAAEPSRRSRRARGGAAASDSDSRSDASRRAAADERNERRRSRQR
jgi:hypothetical protein